VHDHKEYPHAHRTRFWCSQDEARKKASKKVARKPEDNRDTIGMDRYPCNSKLIIRCREIDSGESIEVGVTISHRKHTQYYNVSMPADVLDLIQSQLTQCPPNILLPEIQARYPHITNSQVHSAWLSMSEKTWKKDQDQITSARMVLSECKDIELLELGVPEGVVMVAWGNTRIAACLTGKVTEIVIDATCECSGFLSKMIT
jgi:hypothetical protein